SCILPAQGPLSPVDQNAGSQPQPLHASGRRPVHPALSALKKDRRLPFQGTLQGCAGTAGQVPGSPGPLYPPGCAQIRSGQLAVVQLPRVYREGEGAFLAGTRGSVQTAGRYWPQEEGAAD